MAVDPKRVQAAFLAAVEQPDPAARLSILDRECGSDTELRQRVDALLRAHDNPGSLIVTEPNVTSVPDSPSLIGTRVGPYKLLEQIGEGGMGAVYLAEQSEPVRRRVAIKIIKPGMDSRQVIARFEAERQALAVMDHPNIAKVLDAGTTERGRPYFVMELVKGVPITQYCDQHHLDPPRRLRLFADVCHAVQHAHQKGIIHRDLKPSNVLVADYDEKPVPKVIDFGVAKAVGQQLTEQTMFTAMGQVIGTIEYMSPEQAKLNQLDIDTRSDVYSLGVILYELLTGQTPFDRKRLYSSALDEMLRIIREEDPQTPSTRLSGSDTLPSIAALRQTEPARLTKLVRGELDWIVMKALEKDRGRRYDSPTALAADLARYLADEPVLAGAPSRAYRIRKFVRRNRGPVVAAVAILTVLVAGIVGTTIGLIGQARQRAAAQMQADIASAVSQFQSDMLTAADPARMLGDKVTVLQAVTAAAAELDAGKLRDQPVVEGSLRETIGKTLQALGRYDDAEPQLRKALDLRRGALSDSHIEIARSMNNLATVLRDQGRFLDAEPLLRDALAISERAGSAGDRDTAATLSNLALVLRDQLNFTEAEPAFRRALELTVRTFPPDHPGIAQTEHNLAGLLQMTGDPRRLPEAEALHRAALEKRRRTFPAGHPLLAESLNDVSTVLVDQGKFAEAEPLCRESLELRRKSLPPGHPAVAQGAYNLGYLLQGQGRLSEAEPCYRESLSIMRQAVPADHPNLALILDRLAYLLQHLRRANEAEPLLREALTIRRRSFPANHPTVHSSLNNLAQLLKDQGRLDDAEPLFREAMRIPVPSSNPTAAATVVNLADLLTDRDRPAEAEPLFRQGLDQLKSAVPDDDWRVATARMGLARALIKLDRLPEAEAELLRSEPLLASGPAEARSRHAYCVRTLIALYISWNTAEPGKGYDAKADYWRRKLPTTQPATTREAAHMPDRHDPATAIAERVVTPVGASLVATHHFDFFFLNGGANHNGTVNLDDFNILASRFNAGLSPSLLRKTPIFRTARPNTALGEPASAGGILDDNDTLDDLVSV